MRLILFLFTSMLLSSCVNYKKHITPSYDRLARSHRKIAVLPIHFEGKTFPKKITEAQVDSILLVENQFVQNAIYFELLRHSGRDDNDIQIEIMPIQSSNRAITEAGLSLLDIKDIPNHELKRILGVDAVLSTEINGDMFFHSTKDDIFKNILNSVFWLPVVSDPILFDIKNLNVVSVFIQTELVDLQNESVIWGFRKNRNLQLDQKNTDLAKQLAKDVRRRFPYRQ